MLWIVLAVCLWGLVHSLLAVHKVKEWARQALGERLGRFYRLAYNAFAVVSFLGAGDHVPGTRPDPVPGARAVVIINDWG